MKSCLVGICSSKLIVSRAHFIGQFNGKYYFSCEFQFKMFVKGKEL